MDRLEQTELFQAASCIALYHAIPGEVQTAGFIEKWYQKKKLLLPLIVGDDLRLLLYEGPESLKPGPFGILEPKADGIEVPKNEISCPESPLTKTRTAWDEGGDSTTAFFPRSTLPRLAYASGSR